MFDILKRMILSKNKKYNFEYLNERIEAFYLVGRISTEEYKELNLLLNEKQD